MVDTIKFDPNSIENTLAKMNDVDIDKLAYGAVLVDQDGKILKYNKAEGEITNRNVADCIGKNFFREVAPCTNSPQFFGKFQEGVKAGKMNIMFDYVFDYKMKPTKVTVMMKNDMLNKGQYWIFVKRI